jgi:hypothetical protein
MATRLVAKITNNNGRLSSAAPITLKNQIQEIRSIEDIADVSEVDVSSGSTLVYNPENDKYEVRKLQSDDFDVLNLDGGSF